MKILVDDLGTGLEINITDFALFGDIDEWLLSNAVDASGAQCWLYTKEKTAVIGVPKTLDEALFRRLAEVLRRFGFSPLQLSSFIDTALVPQQEFTARSVKIESRASVQSI